MFSDFVCEWCFLAWKILDTLKDRYPFRTEFLWYEIHPDTPVPGIPMEQHIRGPERFFRMLNRLGEAYGIYFCSRTVFSNTHKALVLGEYAKEIGKEALYVKAVWDAYMVQGLDIGRADVIEHIALETGMSPAGVNRAFSDMQYSVKLLEHQLLSQKYGSERVPTFVVNDEYILTGAQAADIWIELFDRILEITP